jgi:glucose/arabinose dehydrogenase
MGKSVHPFAMIALALLASVGTLLVLSRGPAHGTATLPQDFSDSQVVSGLTNATDMEFAPDGRLFVAEQAGKVRIAKPDRTLTTFLDISSKVDSTGERGLTAVAFDPNFSTNHYVYLYYTEGHDHHFGPQSRRARHRQRRQGRRGQRKAHLPVEQLGRPPPHGRGARLRQGRQALLLHRR